MALVNRNEFAEIVGKSAKWIGKLIDEGMPTEGGGGRGKPISIDTEKAINWLINREVKKQVGDDEDGQPKPGTKDGEDILLTAAKRRKAEIDAAKAESSVMDLEDLAQFLYSIATLFGNELNGLGARIAPEVAAENEPAKCKHITDTECRRIRVATADAINLFISEYRREHGEHGGSTTA